VIEFGILREIRTRSSLVNHRDATIIWATRLKPAIMTASTIANDADRKSGFAVRMP
jgi:hypothetical protein